MGEFPRSALVRGGDAKRQPTEGDKIQAIGMVPTNGRLFVSVAHSRVSVQATKVLNRGIRRSGGESSGLRWPFHAHISKTLEYTIFAVGQLFERNR
jgi:hypothetical protein